MIASMVAGFPSFVSNPRWWLRKKSFGQSVTLHVLQRTKAERQPHILAGKLCKTWIQFQKPTTHISPSTHTHTNEVRTQKKKTNKEKLRFFFYASRYRRDGMGWRREGNTSNKRSNVYDLRNIRFASDFASNILGLYVRKKCVFFWKCERLNES